MNYKEKQKEYKNKSMTVTVMSRLLIPKTKEELIELELENIKTQRKQLTSKFNNIK